MIKAGINISALKANVWFFKERVLIKGKRKIFGFTREQIVRPALTMIIAPRKKME
jgi:hypothetical protein